MEKVLTVVIPSFNVEKYLRQTLESLRNEEILEDVEVLIVDDGSTDGTAKIDYRIFVTILDRINTIALRYMGSQNKRRTRFNNQLRDRTEQRNIFQSRGWR